jgi:hypothetical protein
MGDFYISWVKCKTKIDPLHSPFAHDLREAMKTREKKLLETDIVLEGLYMDSRLNVVLSDEQCAKARALLKQTWKKIQKLSEKSPDLAPENIEEPGPSTRPPLPLDVPYINKDLLPIEDMLVRTEMSRGLSTGKRPSIDICIRELRGLPRVPLETNIIQHWCSKTTANSQLARMADIILASPATQVSVERLFSSLKFLLSPLRTNLDSNLLQRMLFIRSNKDLLEKTYPHT